jgi:hypothetical protein
MLRAPSGDLAARFARAGIRVTRGTQFALTAPALAADVRMRVPLADVRLRTLLEALPSL